MKGVKLYSEIALVLGTWVIYCIVQIITMHLSNEELNEYP